MDLTFCHFKKPPKNEPFNFYSNVLGSFNGVQFDFRRRFGCGL
jgi:hypothetical protein